MWLLQLGSGDWSETGLKGYRTMQNWEIWYWVRGEFGNKYTCNSLQPFFFYCSYKTSSCILWDLLDLFSINNKIIWYLELNVHNRILHAIKSSLRLQDSFLFSSSLWFSLILRLSLLIVSVTQFFRFWQGDFLVLLNLNWSFDCNFNLDWLLIWFFLLQFALSMNVWKVQVCSFCW